MMQFILIVLFLLSALSFVFPKDGLKIQNFGTLRFANFEEVFSLKKTQYADISAIINSAEIEVDTTSLISIDTSAIIKDSLHSVVLKVDSLDTIPISKKESIALDTNIKIYNLEYQK